MNSFPGWPERSAQEGGGLAAALDVVRRRWQVMVAIVIAAVAIAVVAHERATRSYSATASVAFQNGTLSEAALQVPGSGSSEPQREANTEVLTAHSPEVARGVATQLGLSASPRELLDQVSVESAATANVLNIVAKTGSPRDSARLANAFAQQYIAFRIHSQVAAIETAEHRLTQQMAALPPGSPEHGALDQSLQRLSALRAVAGDGANIIGLATPPSSPSGMSLGSTVAIGLLIGLALAITVAFVLESLDRRVTTLAEFENEYRLPVLTAVPQSDVGLAPAGQRVDALEPHRILRSALDFAGVTRDLDTLLVTSAVAGEGKTTVAVDLAHAVALTGRKVVLVELDLRHPTFARQFDINSHDGLTLALTRRSKVEDALIEPLPDLPNLSVLLSGPLPPNPSELLGSSKISETIATLAWESDLVIIDAPPLNPVADTQILLTNEAIHGVLMVARAGKTTRDEARRARSILDRHGVEPLGLVVTGLRDARRYGYEAYGAPRPSRAADAKRTPALRAKPDTLPGSSPPPKAVEPA
jgi:capsular exopolysaccharide synthesis family protein